MQEIMRLAFVVIDRREQFVQTDVIVLDVKRFAISVNSRHDGQRLRKAEMTLRTV